MPCSQGRLRILIVDDDKDLLVVLERLLKRKQYDVVTVSNAADALELLRRRVEFALILLDVMMPGMDGPQFCELQRLDRGTADVPVVIMTSALDGREIATDAGAVGFVRKPFTVDQVLAAVHEHT